MTVPKPFLKARHIKARLKWARSYSKWNHCNWAQVAFSDESSFVVRSSRKGTRVWRKPNERFLPQHCSPTCESGYEVVSVWGAFSVRVRASLVKVSGTSNQQQYIRILEDNITTFAETYHGGLEKFIFQDDNCALHRAKSVQRYMRAKGLSRLDWPAQSPDTSPTEDVWGYMKACLRKRPTQPRNKDELFDILSDFRDYIPNSYFEKLAMSISDRICAVVTSKGINTKC